MLVICNGMPRSASTWAFNVAVGLLQRSEPSSELHGRYDESVARFLESAPPSATHLVVKCHDLDARARALARAGEAQTIYTWRDPADAAVSYMRMFGYDFELACAAIESSLKLYRFHRLRGTALILSYAEIVDMPADAVARISGYLGLGHSPEIVRAVVEETSLDRVKEQVQRLDTADETELIRVGEVVYDPKTLLHRGHVQDGSVGYGKEVLTAQQLRQCDALVQRYVHHPRRTYFLDRAAGAARMLRRAELGRLGVGVRDALFGSRR
jgi:hypothetical protein